MSGDGCGPRLDPGDFGDGDPEEARREDAISRARADRDAVRRERGLPAQPGGGGGAGAVNRFARFDPVERDVIRRLADEHPGESARMLAGYFYAETHRSISVSSVNNILNESPPQNPRRRVRSYQFTSLKRAKAAPASEAAPEPAPSPPEPPSASVAPLAQGDVYESLRSLDAILATLSPGDRARAVAWLANVT